MHTGLMPPPNPIPSTASNTIVISDQEFGLMRNLIYSRFGINLTEVKRTLLVTRLTSQLTQHGFQTFKQYYDYILSDKSGQALSVLVNRISTNHTFFFREKDHFDYLQSTVLPHITTSFKGKRRYNGRQVFEFSFE